MSLGIDACQWNNTLSSGFVWDKLIYCIRAWMHLMGFRLDCYWFCVKPFGPDLSSTQCVLLCLCVCAPVCETGPGHGHTVWQTAMRSHLVLAHQTKRIPQNSSVTRPFPPEARGEQPRLHIIITYLSWKQIYPDWLWRSMLSHSQFALPLTPTSLLLIKCGAQSSPSTGPIGKRCCYE